MFGTSQMVEGGCQTNVVAFSLLIARSSFRLQHPRCSIINQQAYRTETAPTNKNNNVCYSAYRTKRYKLTKLNDIRATLYVLIQTTETSMNI